MLDRAEYVEQAHLFKILAERNALGISTQELLGLVREEILSTTKLPMAIDFLLSELKLNGVFHTAMAKLSHYFSPFQTFVIGEAELRMMKSNAVLINIARGGVVDYGALVQALKDGVIAGAGLDVFEQEPLADDSELWRMENVIMSPHISGGTEIYNQRAVGIFCDNLRRYLAGEPLMNLADPERGY